MWQFNHSSCGKCFKLCNTHCFFRNLFTISVHYYYTKIWFINRIDNSLWRRANARNVSLSISVRWSIYIINSVDKPNFRVSLPHRRSTTVSPETNPLYSLLLPLYLRIDIAIIYHWISFWASWFGGKWGVRSVENVECGKSGVWKVRSVENAECRKFQYEINK